MSETLVERGAAAQLLGIWWGRPAAAEVECWGDLFAAAAGAAAELGEPQARVDELEAALEASSANELAEEYERLLVGPGRVPCAPYESLWRSDAPRREQGVLMGAAAAEVARIYGELGLQVRREAHELPDHVAVEWEALAYALETGADDLAAALLDEHLARWIPAFASAVAAEARQPFYAALARLTAEWTAALAG